MFVFTKSIRFQEREFKNYSTSFHLYALFIFFVFISSLNSISKFAYVNGKNGQDNIKLAFLTGLRFLILEYVWPIDKIVGPVSMIESRYLIVIKIFETIVRLRWSFQVNVWKCLRTWRMIFRFPFNSIDSSSIRFRLILCLSVISGLVWRSLSFSMYIFGHNNQLIDSYSSHDFCFKFLQPLVKSPSSFHYQVQSWPNSRLINHNVNQKVALTSIDENFCFRIQSTKYQFRLSKNNTCFHL